MASFLIPFLSEGSYTLPWNESGVKGLTRELSRVARLNTTRGKFLQILDTQITSWIKTGQVTLVHLFYHQLFQFSGCYCQSLPPSAVLKSFSHTSFHHPGVTLRCEFWKKRFNLSERSNKPWVSGKKTQQVFFFPKRRKLHRPFSGMIFGTTKATFFPYPCWQTWGRCNPPIDLPENGGISGGGREIFLRKTHGKVAALQKVAKETQDGRSVSTHNFGGMLSFECLNLLNKKNILVKPQNPWNISEYSNFITSPYPNFCHTFLQTFITSSQFLGCISFSANVDVQPFKQKISRQLMFFLPRACFLGHTVTRC